jgi:hypothetical protein
VGVVLVSRQIEVTLAKLNCSDEYFGPGLSPPAVGRRAAREGRAGHRGGRAGAKRPALFLY